MLRSILLSAAALALIPLTGSAAPRVADIFGDRMVLQRDRPVPVWGEAPSGTPVTVEFAGQRKSTIAGADTRWRVDLDPFPASSAPRELMVRFVGASGSDRGFRDVLVGEVWLCGGQSNMFWPLGPTANARAKWPGAQNGEEEVTRANWPEIRLNFDAEHELGPAGWHACSPATVRGFSATAYFFGRELHRLLGVPVGLVLRSRGGSSVQAWTPAPELDEVAFVREQRSRLESGRERIQEWNRRMADFRRGKSDAERGARPPALPEDLETARKLQSRGELHDKLVAPVVPFAIRGVIWYQGESNASPRTLAAAYGNMLGALIAGYRRLWDRPDLPFYFVQLPIFDRPGTGDHWHLVREGMRRLHDRTPHTGLVVTYDFSDPANLHPPEKQEVGRRLSLWPLALIHGKPLVPSGPLLRDVKFQNGAAAVSFRHSEGLRSLDGRPLRGFELAGPDAVFHPAAATIAKDTVVLRCEAVPAPTLARFFHGGVNRPNLGNAAGLPASPFTTEEMEVSPAPW